MTESLLDSCNNVAPVTNLCLGWYCTCKIGGRTVWCCTHVASVVWYLGYQRYSEMKSTQSSKLLSVVTDASDLPVTDSESDGDSADMC
jgi:hypothetical protein